MRSPWDVMFANTLFILGDVDLRCGPSEKLSNTMSPHTRDAHWNVTGSPETYWHINFSAIRPLIMYLS